MKCSTPTRTSGRVFSRVSLTYPMYNVFRIFFRSLQIHNPKDKLHGYVVFDLSSFFLISVFLYISLLHFDILYLFLYWLLHIITIKLYINKIKSITYLNICKRSPIGTYVFFGIVKPLYTYYLCIYIYVQIDSACALASVCARARIIQYIYATMHSLW